MWELLIGLIAGYYARQVKDMVTFIARTIREREDAKNTGVVRPQGKYVPQTPTQPQQGVIRQLTPEQFKLRQLEEMDERIRNM